MVDIFQRLYQELKQGREAVLLTILHSQGSAPHREGSHALVFADGTTAGTIGGGIGEYKACAESRQVLLEKQSRIITYVLRPDDAASIGAVCGGTTTVFCQYLSRQIPNLVSCLHRICSLRKERQQSWFVLKVTDTAQWMMAVVGNGISACGSNGADPSFCQAVAQLPPSLTGGSVFRKEPGCLWYCEPLAYPGKVIVFGGGHVALALVPLLVNLGFSCTVVDDRQEFANAERFPEADQTIVADLTCLPAELEITADDYVCIMTRGHVGDYEVQRQVLPCHPWYVGVIGSRTKLAFVRKKLEADGFSPQEIGQCHAPIGLPISAATPEEIAVSIAAEMIAVRARREGREKADARRWRAADAPAVRIP